MLKYQDKNWRDFNSHSRHKLPLWRQILIRSGHSQGEGLPGLRQQPLILRVKRSYSRLGYVIYLEDHPERLLRPLRVFEDIMRTYSVEDSYRADDVRF